MKLFVVTFALLAAACSASQILPSSEYLPPVQELSGVEPILSNGIGLSGGLGLGGGLGLAGGLGGISDVSGLGYSGALADDGYRYKTVRRYRARHRRDVNELSSEYLPPVQQSIGVEQQQIAIPQQLPVQQLGSVGIPSNEYLAPIGPSAQVAQVSSGVLADDGYRYKTVKRYRLRHRRDVNELPSSEYLPPVQQSVGIEQQQIAIPQQLPVQQQLGSVGIPSNEYLAPVGPSAQVAQVSSGVLADDGYRYRTVKRYRLRHRRDVNELSSEYLPPVQQSLGLGQQVSQLSLPVQSLGVSQSVGLPSNEYLAPIAPAGPIADVASGVLADDGYRYKTVKRYRLRHRRSVDGLPSVEYLPPVQQQVLLPQVSLQQQLPIQQVSSQYLAPIDVSPVSSNILSGVLSDDGYRYKTVKKIRRRH